MAVDLVGRGAERDPLSHEPALAVDGAQRLDRQFEHLGDLVLAEHPLEALLDQPDERIDRVVGDEGRRRLERAEQVDGAGRQADLLVRLAQGGRAQVRVLVIAAAAGERDLAGVAAEVRAALGEDGVQCAGGVEVEGDEDGGLLGAGDGDPRRRLRLQEGGVQRGRELRARRQVSSTRSSKKTSPSSVRCTGHLAAITWSFST